MATNKHLFNSFALALLASLLVVLSFPSHAARAAELLPNGGFEQTAQASSNSLQAVRWLPFGDGYVLDQQTRHSGNSSIRCANATAAEVRGAQCPLTLNQQAPTPVLVSGWSKAQDVDGGADSDYSIYADVQYTDGSSTWALNSPFDSGTHGWQRRHMIIVPKKPIRSINLYALFRNHGGTVWFDDFAAGEVSGRQLFDSQPIAAPKLAPGAQSGWFVRDVGANSALLPLQPDKASWGLLLDRFQSNKGGIIVKGELRNTAAFSRAVTVYYVERFDDAKAVWWNDIRSCQAAGGGSAECGNLTTVGYGATGSISLYQFGCVTGQKHGEALGIPPWMGPRASRIFYNPAARLLILAYDIALMPAGDPGGHDRSPIGIARYAVSPQWGFRDAAANYYALFPDAFQRRATAEGLWMPFTDPSTIPNVQDFHFAYHEGDNSVAGDRALGILSFRYVEPMTYWMPLPAAAPRTNATAAEYLHKFAEQKPVAVGELYGPEMLRRQAQAVLYSGSETRDGRYNMAFRDTPWCNGSVFVLNPSPRLPHPPGTWTKAALNQAGEPEYGKPNQPDGEYLDSLEAWSGILDYNPNSLRYSGVSPTFTPDDFHPTLPTWFSVYDAAASLAHDLRQHGKLLFANSVPWQYSAFGPLLDVEGTETDMFDSDGHWVGESDAVLNLRRTVSYHRPYLLLLNSNFDKDDPIGIELYFERCLFYGIYPSMFSVDAADHPYWQNPALYNRDRPLFKKYIPLVQKVSAAGWEPVTWAWSSNGGVWLERYGNRFLTVLNPSKDRAAMTVHIDADKFLTQAPQASSAEITVTDLVSGAVIETVPARSSIAVSLALEPSQTRLLTLSVAKN